MIIINLVEPLLPWKMMDFVRLDHHPNISQPAWGKYKIPISIPVAAGESKYMLITRAK